MNDLTLLNQVQELTTLEYAALIGVSDRTVRRWLKENNIQPDSFIINKQGSKTPCYKRDKLDAVCPTYQREAGKQVQLASLSEQGRLQLEFFFSRQRLISGDITQEQFIDKVKVDPVMSQLINNYAQLASEYDNLLLEVDGVNEGYDAMYDEFGTYEKEIEELKIENERLRVKAEHFEKAYFDLLNEKGSK